jgi:cytoskeletal protein RodZ
VTVLDNIEQQQLDKLPDRVFLRGFLSAFAREVGLDPDDVTRRYLEQVDSAAKTVGRAVAQPADASRDLRDREQVQPRVTETRWLTTAAIVAVSLVGYYSLVRWRTPADTAHPARSTPRDLAQSSQPSPSSAAAADRAEAGTVGSGSAGAAPASDAEVLRIDIRPRGPCWLSATVDGSRVVYRLMESGEQQTIDAHDEAVLRVGDPSAFAFSIDGLAGRSLGRPGEAVTVRITKQNYREFLDR